MNGTTDAATALRRRLDELCSRWRTQGLPPAGELDRLAAEMEQWKQRHQAAGIWPIAGPSMLTATLDDGIGRGIGVIERWATVAGVRVVRLGLVQPADAIVAAAGRQRPDLVGLTVLQADSEPDLCRVGRRLPAGCRLVAGGAAFRYDPQLAGRCGVHAVFASVADFLAFLLEMDRG